MNRFLSLGVFISFLYACAQTPPVPTPIDRSAPVVTSPSTAPVLATPSAAKPVCDNRNVMQTRTRRYYEDSYGTMMTTDPLTLTTRKTVYGWGIANQAPLEKANFAAYLKPMGRFSHFNAKIYVDSGIQAPMEFLFRNGDRNGEVLKAVTVNPGQAVGIDFKISGVKKMYVAAELGINHGKATRIIIGEPELYNCR